MKRAQRRRDVPADPLALTDPEALSADRSAMPIAIGDGVYRPLKAAEGFARDLVHEMVTSRLRSGDRLPSEAVMLAEHKLSRESLREGLRLLEVQGLIQLRRGPGGGPVVGELDPASLGRTSTLYYSLAGATYAELLDAWVTVDSALADRAARNPDRARVRATMSPFLRTEPSCDDESLHSFVLSHTQFHTAVASLAENRVLEILLQSVGGIVAHHIIQDVDTRQERETIEGDHIAIANAIIAGAPRKAASAMSDHINGLIGIYRELLGTRLDDLIDWQ